MLKKKKKKNKKSLSTFVINHKYDSWRESFSSYLFQKLLTLSYSRIKSRFPTIINIPRIAFGKILWTGGENLLSSSIKKYIRDTGRLSVWKMTSSLIILRGRGRGGRRKKTKR